MQSVTSSNHLEWTMFRFYIGSLNGCFMKKSKKVRKGGAGARVAGPDGN